MEWNQGIIVQDNRDMKRKTAAIKSSTNTPVGKLVTSRLQHMLEQCDQSRLLPFTGLLGTHGNMEMTHRKRSTDVLPLLQRNETFRKLGAHAPKRSADTAWIYHIHKHYDVVPCVQTRSTIKFLWTGNRKQWEWFIWYRLSQLWTSGIFVGPPEQV